MALALTNCAGSLPGNPKLSVAVTDECDRLATPAPAPQPSAVTDAGDAAAAYAAWGAANRSRLIKYAECEKRVREQYAKGGQP